MVLCKQFYYCKFSIHSCFTRTKLNCQGEGLPYKSDRNAHQKIQIKPLRQTNVGVAQA